MLDCAHRLNLCALLGWIVLLGMVWALLGGQPASAAPGAEIIYVKPGAPDGNAGDSWATARSLQSALGTAQTGDEIWVAAGIYVPGNTVNATFQLKSGVAMYGGFVGTESSRTARDWKTNLTVLSGDVDNNDSDKVNGVVLDADNIVGNNAYHVVTANGVNAVPVVEPGGPYAATEGTPLALDGAGSSDDVGIAAYAWDCTDDGTVDHSRATPAGSSCL